MNETPAVSSTIAPEPPPAAGQLQPLTVLQAFNHPLRWAILQRLAPGTALTGTDLAKLLGEFPDTVNKALRVLRDAGVVTCAPSTDARYLAYTIPAAFRKEIGQLDYGFCVLRLATARPPVAKD